ncbi:uncharacterized protein LOC132795651 [Drosophila nasuta]|uniref:uncharacterized protein LOC132795651 n=1 Tax=Drosophila nasuta TaxID=42062 RepID=UPI00295E4972|nr:uncharacterized protein LOC132795651 [Drosophila nasuta]
MGASNSKPQTVQMSNASPFQISRDVLERVEKASAPPSSSDAITHMPTEIPTAASQLVCEKCARTATAEKTPQVPQPMTAAASSWTRRSTEIEELQFSKTLDRVHHLFGQPVKWAKANECSDDIEGMERQLIACYREYGSEPLKCAQLASQYHSFVFNKQVAAVQNTKSSSSNGQQLSKGSTTTTEERK